MDPADAYVHLYDLLTDADPGTLDDWAHEEATQLVADEVCSQVQSAGDVSDDWMPEDFKEADSALARRLLGVLLGLDHALRHATETTDAVENRNLGYLRFRLCNTGRLNSDQTSGWLLFRRARSSRPGEAAQTLGDLLNLIRVPSALTSRMEPIKWIPAVDDLPEIEQLNTSDLEPLPQLPIAQIPMLAEGGDLVWTTKDRPRKYYSVAPASSRLSEYLPEVLAALDESGAIMALLPEASLDDHMAREWEELLRENPPPESSRLAWLLLGTGPVTRVGERVTNSRKPNRAVLVHRSGSVLLWQDKQRGFTFTAEQQRKYGVTELGETTRDEYHFHGGDRLRFIEGRYGRFGIEICEDLGRHELQSAVIGVGVSHLMVPVLAAAMHEDGWQARAAQILGLSAGTDVAVTNSLAIHRRTLNGSPAPTLLTITAPGRSSEYPEPMDIVRAYPCPMNGIDARKDALTPRTAEW